MLSRRVRAQAFHLAFGEEVLGYSTFTTSMYSLLQAADQLTHSLTH